MSGVNSGGGSAGAKGHIFLPAWWIHGFEWTTQVSLGQRGREERNVWGMTQGSGILPALSPHELRGLATVLTALQKAILCDAEIAQKKQKKIVLFPLEHFHQAGSMPANRLYGYERLLQMLPCLMIQNQSVRAHGTLAESPQPWLRLVEAFSWRVNNSEETGHILNTEDNGSSLWARYLQFKKNQGRVENNEEARNTLQVEVDLGSLGVELCFGLSDGYVDVIRPDIRDHRQFLDDRPFTQPPIAAWHSLWLELTPYEMMLYLKLEKAMQWEFRWIGVDGVFGVKLEDFLEQGLRKTQASSPREEDGGEAERLRTLERSLAVLKRFGKKLEYHGYLTQLHDMHHRLLDLSGIPMDSAPMILWQASAQRILEDRLAEYKNMVRPHVSAPLMGYLKNHWTGFLAGSKESSQKFGMRLWQELSQVGPRVLTDLSLSSSSLFEFYETSLWSPLALFYEWAMRSQEESPWPKLPEVLASCPLAPLVQTRDESMGPWIRRFEEFCLLLQDMPEITRIINEEPLASLAAPVTVRLPEMQDIYRQQRTVVAESDGVSSVSLSEKDPEKRPQAVSPGVRSQETEPTLQASAEGLQQQGTRHARGVSMMRTAENELIQLENRNHSQYQELRRAYLGSLDEIGQKLIQDVQARMQPHLFEEHLRKRIIRFMVENPGVWSISKDQAPAQKKR